MEQVPRDLVLGQVVDKVDWKPGLFSLFVKADIGSYQAGQFTKLALQEEDGHWLKRAYSMVSSFKSSGHELEFLVVTDPTGRLSPMLEALNVGDDLYVGQTVSGFMTADDLPDYAKELWLLSTGTAVGAFLSLLREPEKLNHLDRIVLVHAVRYEGDLVYQDLIKSMAEHYGEKFAYVPIVSRESINGALQGRIPTLLLDGQLQQRVGLQVDPNRSFVYLCGNPNMIHDASDALKELGLTKHLRRKPGHFASENYW